MRCARRAEVGCDVLGLDRADIHETARARPLTEPRNVPLVLRHRVRRAAVDLELNEKAPQRFGRGWGPEWAPWSLTALGRPAPRTLHQRLAAN